MPKRRLSFTADVPPYVRPRNAWRLQLHTMIAPIVKKRSITFDSKDKLELHLTLYMQPNELNKHDIDNRLKDIMDTLQGRVGGPKAKRVLKALIPNDHQIYRATVEKKVITSKNRGIGAVTVRKYQELRAKRCS